MAFPESTSIRASGGVLFGCRVPKHYFMTSGYGETDEGEGTDPWETGSYDLALLQAGIQDFNVMQYTSVMPKDAVLLTLDEAKPLFKHGAVLETIMSAENGQRGERLTVGVARNKSDMVIIGGFAAKYKYKGFNSVSKAEATKILTKSLTNIFERRGYTYDEYEMIDFDFIIKNHTIERRYGSVLAAICFVSYSFEPIEL